MADLIAPGFNPGVKMTRDVCVLAAIMLILFSLCRQNPINVWTAIFFSEAMRPFEKENAEPNNLRFWRERLAYATIPAAKTKPNYLTISWGSATATPQAMIFCPFRAGKFS